MRRAPADLGREGAGDVVDAEGVRPLLRDPRVEDDLQQEVAELAAQFVRGGGPARGRVECGAWGESKASSKNNRVESEAA